ncbi:MAG TPA: hypothetical protein VMI56_21370 [Reyranella sp.]|nr:hypothetical protein [Reyranella sp.]
MKIASRRGIAFAIVMSVALLPGCVTGSEQPAAIGDVGASSASNKSCDSLTDARRKLAVEIDDLESGKTAPSTWKAALFTFGAVGAKPYQQPALQGAMLKEREKVLVDMRGRQAELTQQIEQQQCTLEARAKAGAIKEIASPQYDGAYAGKGNTESWCAQPTLSVVVSSGKIDGALRESAKATTFYAVQGQLYEGGGLALQFRRPDSKTFTDDVDAQLKDNVLSFTVKLDLSPKACTYRFAVSRTPTDRHDGEVAASTKAPLAKGTGESDVAATGPWTTRATIVAGQSVGSCADGSIYKFDLSGQTLTGANENGRMFSAPIADNGWVDTTFKSPTGNSFQITGNAKTRDLTLINIRAGCCWKLVPRP